MVRYPLRAFIQPAILRRLCDKPKLSNKPSNTPRPPKDPPDEGYQPTSVDHDGIDVAPFVRPSSFRQFSGPDEKLGPGAGKALPYKNSCYFGYHRFSFMELMSTAVELRDERRLDGGLQASIEADEESESGDNQLETMKKLEGECDAILANQAKQAEKAKEKCLQDMSEEELKEWCKQKEEDIKKKEQEKKDAKCSPKEKNIQDMSEEELKVWCQKKEEDIKKKEQLKKDAEAKDCKEKQNTEAAEKTKCESDENKKD
ncbi:stress response protein NST1 [Drosophila erecta]|uniref:Uncharacterized protein n=1 Tax=Drosophila erecta TaxID=7220 RepID=B3NEY8_DROER|nr:stress response protein NST1 [Drosophila erecta]EDV50261.1 uncharacterized protein Dere_GG14540 [Drosophila erecta]